MKSILIIFVFGIIVSLSKDPVTECGEHLTCEDCIKNNPCGWCSQPVVYSDGTLGPYCAGKPSDPNNPPPNYKPWTCPKDYQNQACYGYVCEKVHFSCISSGAPGRGVPLAECLGQCFPPTYECNSTQKQCYQVTPGHGTDLPDCVRQCQQPTTTTGITTGADKYDCDPVTLTCKIGSQYPKMDCETQCGKPANITPVWAIGDYRGLQVNPGFEKGEWQAQITKDNVTIVDPTGAIWARGAVRQMNNELWLVSSAGTRRGLFAIQNLPEVIVLTWGMGVIGGGVPTSFDNAMSTGTVFTFAKCLTPDHCKFHLFTALQKLQLKQQALTLSRKRQIDDPCSVYPDCSTCIKASENCGWCSVNVIYNNTIIGRNCAGTNTTISPRINCTGIFSTEDCSHATTGSTTGPPVSDKYYCDPIMESCVASPNGTLPKDVCGAQCTLTPIVPPILQDKYFRGLEVDLTYLSGEWRVHFGKTDVTLVYPSGVVEIGEVTTIGQYLTITFTGGRKIQSLWQYTTGPTNGFLTWAWGAPNGQPPKNYDEAMFTPNQKEFWFVSCLDEVSTDVCNFSV